MAQQLESWPCFGTNNRIFAEMKSVLHLVLILFVLGSCIEHRPDDGVAKSEVKPKPTKKNTKLRGTKVYEGKIPCADCSGIDQHLVLRGDTTGAFRLTEIYRDATEDGDEVIVTTGSWKYYQNKTTGKVLFLSEGSLKDSSRFQRYKMNGTYITQLDFDGKWIKSPNNYRLKLVSSK